MAPKQGVLEVKTGQPAEQGPANTYEHLYPYWSGNTLKPGEKLSGLAAWGYGEYGERFKDFEPDYVWSEHNVASAVAEGPIASVVDIAPKRESAKQRRRIGRLVGRAAVVAAAATGFIATGFSIFESHDSQNSGRAAVYIDPSPELGFNTAPETSVTTIEPQTTIEDEETLPDSSVLVTENPTTLEPSTTAAETTEPATTTTISPSTTTSITTTSTTTMPSTTTTLAPTTTTIEATTTVPQPSDSEIAVRSIFAGESLLTYSGRQVASMEIPAIGLNGADVFISNDLPVPLPGEPYYDLAMQFDYNQDGVIGKVKNPATGITLYDEYADFQIAQGNPIYRLQTDAAPDDDSFVSGLVGAGVIIRSARQSYGSWAANSDPQEARANRYVPTVAIDSGSVIPGQAGNVLIFGHRTTESAPFASLDAMQEGDTITFTLADGQVTTYRMVQSERQWAGYSQAELQAINSHMLNYVGPNGEISTATLYACDPQGSSDYRIIYRFVLVPQAP